MASKKKDGFIAGVSDFFKRVNQEDTIKVGSNSIQTHSAPASSEELEKRRDMQVFRQFLQSKNWNIKHTELFDEYRRMDITYPIINAALRLYSQEVCLSGDTVIGTPAGDFTIKQLYDKNKTVFYTKSYDKKYKRVEWNFVSYIKNNGIKPVFKVTVNRNVDPDNLTWDKKLEASFKCTDNHKILVNPDATDENERFKELKDLKVGDVIWSMYYYVDPDCSCKEPVFNQTVIESIVPAGSEEVFDLVDVGQEHHFMIKLTDSFYISVHNCTKDLEGNVIEIITENKRVKKLLEDCYFQNLKLNSTSYLHVKSMLKFGNHFSYLDTRKGVGVVDLISLPPEAIRIQLQNNSVRLDDFKYMWFGQANGMFEPWEVVHWKNIEDIETEPYGQSILRSIVDTYRRIILMREAMIVYRITRAPQRLLFKIDTTGLDADGALKMAEDLKKQMYKKPLVNPVTGELDHKYNPISIEENLYMPSYEGDTSDVRVLEGANNLDAVEDYKIIKDDLFAGLLIPKSYLTFEEDLCLRSDTKLKTNEGVMTIKELADTLTAEPDKKIYSLSCNKYGIIASGKILWCRPTKLVNQLYKIQVNGEFVIEATDNHPFMMGDLTYKRADLIQPGDKLKTMFEEDFTVTNVEVIDLETEEFVYDLEVDEYHNFALECGIFVHNSNKAALAQEDLRFAGAIKQYQSHYIEGLLHIGLVHLHINGCSKEELESFEIRMNTNSTLAEKTKNEILQQRFDLAKKAWDSSNDGLNMMSYTQMAKDILHFTNEEIQKSIEDQLIEKKLYWRMKELTENGMFQEPDPESQKMIGLDKQNDIFSQLIFEQEALAKNVKSILNEKLSKEIAFLLKEPKAKPSPKMIENIMLSEYSFDTKPNKIRNNISRTEKDLL